MTEIHQKTPESAQMVRELASDYASIRRIAFLLGVSPNTLTKHYSTELAQGVESSNHRLASVLYQSALNGDTGAARFILACKAGWKQTEIVEHQMGGTLAERAGEIGPEERQRLLAGLRGHDPRTVALIPDESEMEPKNGHNGNGHAKGGE